MWDKGRHIIIDFSLPFHLLSWCPWCLQAWCQPAPSAYAEPSSSPSALDASSPHYSPSLLSEPCLRYCPVWEKKRTTYWATQLCQIKHTYTWKHKDIHIHDNASSRWTWICYRAKADIIHLLFLYVIRVWLPMVQLQNCLGVCNCFSMGDWWLILIYKCKHKRICTYLCYIADGDVHSFTGVLSLNVGCHITLQMPSLRTPSTKLFHRHMHVHTDIRVHTHLHIHQLTDDHTSVQLSAFDRMTGCHCSLKQNQEIDPLAWYTTHTYTDIQTYRLSDLDRNYWLWLLGADDPSVQERGYDVMNHKVNPLDSHTHTHTHKQTDRQTYRLSDLDRNDKLW